MPWYQAAYVVTQWQSHGLRNIRFSGGEPTLYRGLVELVSLAAKSCERIAISTNGTAHRDLYDELVHRGANDFSVSLDACCSALCDKMTGRIGMLDKILDNIRHLSSHTYVTAGIVLTPENEGEVEYTVAVARELGVKDIRIIPSAQWKPELNMAVDVDIGYPILHYRMENVRKGRPVRGLKATDSARCWLALDDMAVVGEDHYPCIIYLREQGRPIGRFTTEENVRRERAEWVYAHNCHDDPICRANCLDVCVDYNNKAQEQSR
jgi:molybdenum cofactor biosynthesis enzyme MoaA